MKKVRVLFQGDSITDAGRDKRNFRDMGKGYPKYAAEQMIKDHPEVEFDFINLGISGNRTDQLFDRLYSDAVALEPDVISILIGINDIWHRYGDGRVETTDAQLALNYRCILERLRAQTNAKIVMIAPFLLDFEGNQHLRPDLERILPIIRDLAKEFADVYLPLDEIFAEVLPTQPEPLYYSRDAVHPNTNGSMFIGGKYAEAVKALIENL